MKKMEGLNDLLFVLFYKYCIVVLMATYIYIQVINAYLWNAFFSSFPFFFSLAGEVERLLKEYRQNQELVRNIGAHYYQIIYPVQLRHHEKMGISTREIGTKVSLFFFLKSCRINTT